MRCYCTHVGRNSCEKGFLFSGPAVAEVECACVSGGAIQILDSVEITTYTNLKCHSAEVTALLHLLVLA